MSLFALERQTTTSASSASRWRLLRTRGGVKEAATARRSREGRFTRAARNTVREEEEGENDDGSSKRTVVELFSGIGGMRLALEDANVLWNGKDDDDGAAAAVHFIAVDNNCNANAVYRANFCSCSSSSSSSEVLEGNIESIDVERLLYSSCEILTMSPPCQPYTRKGKKERENDARSTALARIIDAFEDAGEEEALPKRILLENVVGFELGTERERFISSLEKHRYHVKEYVGLSPETMLGVPVKRPRYYLLARREKFGSFDINSFESPSVEDIAKYLDGEIEIGLEIEKKKIEKYWKFFDVVNVASSRNVASTFTSGYGKTVFSGSYILFDNCDIAKRDVHANNAYRLVKDDNYESDEQFAERVSRSMRYFSPRELCRLHGIKEQFVFPSSLSKRQQYKLIGNGISVNVVSKLLEYLFK